MVAITVILAAVIAAFVFGLGGQQQAAPTASIVAANYPDTGTYDLKIQHKGGDTLKGGDWKLSIVPVGQSPKYNVSAPGNDFSVGAQIISANTTLTSTLVTNSTVEGNPGFDIAPGKYDVKLVHVPTNSMLLDTVVDVH
jgi:FlaG/FlaF family flagellin (archaellin)